MNKNMEKQELELTPELLLQREREPGRCRSKRANYADINLIVRRETHKRQSVLVVVPIQIDTNPSLNNRAVNRKNNNMELAMEMDLSSKRHVASEHNRKR